MTAASSLLLARAPVNPAGVNSAPGSHDDGWVPPPPVTLSDGTRVHLYKDGEAMRAAYEAIADARFRICIEVYIFHSDETGHAIADLLCKKARDGVRVYVIYDSFGSIDTDPELFRQMRRAGVHVHEFHPFRPWDCRYSWRPANRDHRKLLFIDSDIGGVGGVNVGREYAGSWVVGKSPMDSDLWRDNAVGIVGPQARLLFRSFAKTWHYVNHGGRIGKAELLHPLGDGDFGLLASVPARNSPLRPLLLKHLREARRRIQLTMAYFAPDDDLIDALCSAARRGVRVQLMLPAECDMALLLIAARSFYEKLLAKGVEIYERQGTVLHAKTMVIDGGLSILGSTNLDHRSIEYNCEISALIRSEELGKQMCDLFENDMRFAKQITLEEWRHRPTYDRIVQWAVSGARYLL